MSAFDKTNSWYQTDRMAAPACDRDDRVYFARWSPTLHPRCVYMQRITVYELLCHCTHRHTGIGVLPTELLVQILGHVRVAYM